MCIARSVRRSIGCLSVAVLFIGCGHYKDDFSCKGYPEASSCRPTKEVYEMRHEQLTKMKKEGDEDVTSSSSSAASDRVAAVAGQTELQLGQPNIKPPQVMGVWIAPWRDSKNFLHEASLVYAIVEPADWTYGRKPKGVEQAGSGRTFVPYLSKRTVESTNARGVGPNGGQPVLAPAPVVTPQQSMSPVIPSPAQDPAAILRQLQQQVPGASGPVPAPYGGPVPPTDPETAQEELQERMQEQRDKMFQ